MSSITCIGRDTNIIFLTFVSLHTCRFALHMYAYILCRIATQDTRRQLRRYNSPVCMYGFFQKGMQVRLLKIIKKRCVIQFILKHLPVTHRFLGYIIINVCVV